MTHVQRLDDWISAIEQDIANLKRENEELRKRLTIMEQMPHALHEQIVHDTIRQSQILVALAPTEKPTP